MNDEEIMEKIVSEQSVFEGKLVKVHKLDVTLPSGKPALREVVRHPGASAIVPVDEKGMVTMVRQFRTAVGRVLLEIPAGKLDYRGEDRLEAARRELREETGLTAANWVHLTDITTTPGFCDELISIYLATGLTAGETDPDEDEFLNIEKKPLAELAAMAMRGEICDSKTLVAILMADRYLRGEDGHGV
ncbi:MAG: NUDIX hydrolase [Clostridia bacterium]|nr:NUDIX hydrolase [Clostridia bacterium]